MKLNSKQGEAVACTEGPLLILAGAGAGKTKTLTERVVSIIKKGTSPDNILAITFTNKAAKEMRERIMNRLESEGIYSSNYHYQSDLPVIKTFHSFGVMVLRRHGNFFGLTKNFLIKDTSDTNSLIKEAVLEEGLDPKEHDPSRFKFLISKWKSDCLTVGEAESSAISFAEKKAVSIWRRYEEKLKKENSVDFDDLLIKTYQLFTTQKDVLLEYQNKFRYIHVDEYQDTNEVQYKITKLLAEKSKNICVVGDADQNIYSWRGANIKNILQFEKDYPNTKLILLEENYRSTKTILDAANSVIKKNQIRVDKNLFTSNNLGEKITLAECYDERAEAVYIAKKSKELLETNPNASVAVLYRANFQSRILEEAFLSLGVPYVMLGTKFFERKEIKDVVSYLRAATNRDSLSDLKRVFEFPKRGIGKVTMLKVFSGGFSELSVSVQKKVYEVYTVLDKVKEYSTTHTLSETIIYLIKESNIEQSLSAGGDADLERLENIRELVSLATKYDNFSGQEALEMFFEESSLVSDQDNDSEDKSGVRLMTVHASKGLEFDSVFIAGLEHELFPHAKIGGGKKTKEESEEERRLFYVAITRAKKNLLLTYASIRTVYGSRELRIPSEFIADIPDDLLFIDNTNASKANFFEDDIVFI